VSWTVILNMAYALSLDAASSMWRRSIAARSV
jgi:hypothetical protein